jgi:hypothetical protein
MTRIYRIEHRGEPRHVLATGDEWRLVNGDIFGTNELGERVDRTGHRVLAPVLPSKIVAIGLNYKDHAAEQNKPLPAEPMMFMKPSTAVIGPDDAIVLPDGAGRVDHEAEVGVVIGKRARHVAESDARHYVLGLTCVNDVTARELQRKDVQYTRAKGFDTFAPLGPCIAVGPRRRVGQRRAPAGVHDARADLLDRPADRVHFESDDLIARRHHLDRHACGHRAARRRRSRDRESGRHRRADQRRRARSGRVAIA